MEDYSLLDSCCSCPTGHPPCSYCTDTYSCESCGHRHYSADADEHKKHGWICEECGAFYAPKGFWFWFMAVFMWAVFIGLIPLLVVVYATYREWRGYKLAGYLVPGFFRFFYEFNFTQTYYTKIIKR